MTIHIKGRSSFAEAQPRITIVSEDGLSTRFEIDGAELQSLSNNNFKITSKAEHGVDAEHDSAYVFYADLVGVQFTGTWGNVVEFTGALMSVSHYPEVQTFEVGDEITGKRGRTQEIEPCLSGWCEDDDCVRLPYLPPEVPIKAQVVKITMSFGGER